MLFRSCILERPNGRCRRLVASVVRRRARQQEPLLAGRSWLLFFRSWPLWSSSWSLFGRCWPLLGRSWLLLGRSWVALGRSLAPLGRSRAALGTTRKNQSKNDAQNDRFGRPKALQNDAKIEPKSDPTSITKTMRKRTDLRRK